MHLMLTLVLGLLVANHPFGHGLATAWSWSHQTPHPSPADDAGPPRPSAWSELDDRVGRVAGDDDAERVQPGMETLLSNLMKDQDALASYKRKPDCFLDAIVAIKAHCEESRMDEGERIQAAIGMTMCELATARHYLPPMECAAYATRIVDGHATLHWPLLDIDSQGQALCVDALSRSAQFWSSYSGYLREIPQLCFTFRRWIDIDTAKDIYRNITQEKAVFVRFLVEREQDAKVTQQQWEKMAEGMRDLLGALRTTSNGMRDASEMLTMAVLNDSQSLLEEVQSAIQKIGDRDRANHGEIITHFYSMLESLRHEHSDNLLGVVRAIESSVTSELSITLALIKNEGLRNMNATAQLERRLGWLEGGLAAMQNSLEQLAEVMDDSLKLFQASLEQAKTAQAIQNDTMVSMTNLVEAVQLLTQTTHDEITSINRTTFALKESLGNRAPNTEWIRAVLFSILEVFPGPLVDAAIRSRVLYVTFRVVYALWHGARFLVSLLVSALVLLNARGWMSREVPGDREAHVHMRTGVEDKKPVRPRTRMAQRLVRPRFSRIPDRLCRAHRDAAWL